MAQSLRWKERRQSARPQQGVPRRMPLRELAANLSQMARAALAEPYMLVVERRAIGLRRLPRQLDGLRILQISDVHHSPFTGSAQIERAIETANSLEPDIIALTGDYVSHERSYAAPCAEMLGRLRARHGVYAVLGNHDHWTDAALITDLFRAEGIRVLVNEGMRFEMNGASFWLAGVDDTMVGLEDLPLALAGSRADEMKLLLAHNLVTLPNLLTVLRMVLIPVFVSFIFYQKFGWALGVFMLAGVTDGLDGLLARRFNQKSQLGAILDPIADKLLLVTSFIVLSLKGL